MASSCFRRVTFYSRFITRHLLTNYQFDRSFNPRCPLTRRHTVSERFFGSQNVLQLQANEKESVKNDVPDDTLFDEGFRTITKFLVNHTESLALPEIAQWFEKVLNYNVPHGKRQRGLTVLKTYKVLVPESSLEDKKLAVLLGWCIEMVQAYFLVLDDIMDQSITRRGLPCWYRQKEVGLNAVNDAVMLESGLYLILKEYFAKHPYYTAMLDVIHETIQLTSFGQCLDMISTPSETSLNLDKFTVERHLAICKLKTSYYTICLPVRLALLLAGREDFYNKDVETLLLNLGQLFQVQDDYLDCFGDPLVMGKQGTDIEEGKCSWPIVTALQLVGPEDKLLLKEHYGKKSPESIEVVMNLYKKVELPDRFREYEDETFASLNKQIEALGQKSDTLARLFEKYVYVFYKRTK